MQLLKNRQLFYLALIGIIMFVVSIVSQDILVGITVMLLLPAFFIPSQQQEVQTISTK